jgi:hypothetical protein
MYPVYGPLFSAYSPYGYDDNNHFYDERVFGPPGGPMAPPPGPPPFGPPGQSPGAGAPTTPPPAYVPAQTQAGAFAVDPGAIRRCLYRFTYVWLTNRQQFWFYPTFIGRRSISGYRWNGFRWVFYGTDLRRIQSFQCV